MTLDIRSLMHSVSLQPFAGAPGATVEKILTPFVVHAFKILEHEPYGLRITRL